VISTFDSIALFFSVQIDPIISNSESRGLCSNTHTVGSDLRQCVIYNNYEQKEGIREPFWGQPRLREEKELCD